MCKVAQAVEMTGMKVKRPTAMGGWGPAGTDVQQHGDVVRVAAAAHKARVRVKEGEVREGGEATGKAATEK